MLLLIGLKELGVNNKVATLTYLNYNTKVELYYITIVALGSCLRF